MARSRRWCFPTTKPVGRIFKHAGLRRGHRPGLVQAPVGHAGAQGCQLLAPIGTRGAAGHWDPVLFQAEGSPSRYRGFGFFAGFTILPAWLAWDTFREANGVGGLQDLRARLSGIQKGARIDADPSGRIGCCLIAECQFFQQSEWGVATQRLVPENANGG